MRELLIIRHAIAHERDPAAWPNDDQRPLTEKGCDRFRAAARGLARVIDAPAELLSSSLVRARQTAALLERHAAFPRTVELDALRPETETAALIDALRERSGARIAVVGHEPNLSRLVAVLLGGPEAGAAVEMKKGAVAQVAFVEHVAPGEGKLLSLLPPRLLRALSRKR